MPRRFLPALLTGVLSIASCATPPPPAGDPVSQEPVGHAPTPEAELGYQLLLGEVALMREALDAAADAYLRAMMLTEDPAIAERATQLSLHRERDADAGTAARRWRELDPDSLALVEAELLVALRRDDLDAAVRHADVLLDRWPDDEDGKYRALGRLLIEETGPDPVLALLERLAEEHDTAQAWHMLGLLALRNDRADTAGRAAENAKSLRPDWSEGYVLGARVLAYRGRHDEAIRMLEPVVEAHPEDARARFALAGIHIAAGDEGAAIVELERLVEQVPSFMDAHWTLGLLLLRAGQPDDAERHLHVLLDDPSRRWDAAYYIAGAHEHREDWAGALEWFERVERGEQRVNARIKAADMLFRLGRPGEARARLESLRRDEPDARVRIWHAEAELLRRNEHVGEALEVYGRALEETPESSQLRFARALLHEREGHRDAAIADLKTLYEQNPDSAEAQNALGYVLADRGRAEDLPRARRLIRAALEQEPDNAAYLDSKGWVLFRMGRFDQARAFLEEAWAAMPSGEIGAHLGEVLWEMGKTDAAREIWREAARIEPDHDVLHETMERLLDE